MAMRSYLILVTLCLLTLPGWSQQITGKIFDTNTNTPLAGATIQVKGAGGTVSAADGTFSLPCGGTTDIFVSYLGYSTYEMTVKDCPGTLSIGMALAGQTLNEVEVTATSIADKTLLQQPASIVPLNRTELQRGTGLYLDDAINTNIPGVFMERRTISAGQQFNIRGYGNGARGTNGINSNFDGQGSKVYLNGIPITDAEGITVMDDIDFSSIDRVEVSKGPSGTLYGLAIAGVVNLQTRKATKGQTSVGQDLLAGSYGLFRSTTHAEIGGENASLLVNYGRQEFDGYMVHTASHKNFMNVVGDFEFNAKQSMSTYFGYSDSYDERNGELTIEQYANFDYSGNSRYIANNAHSAVKTFRAGLAHHYRFNDHVGNTTTFFGSSQKVDNSSAGGWTDKSPLNYGVRSTLDMNFALSDAVTLTGLTGVELQKMNAQTNGFSMVADSTNPNGYHVVGSIRSIQATTSATASYFTQWTLSLPKDLSLTAGVGFNSMMLSLQDRLWSLTHNHPGDRTPPEYKATYQQLLSPSVALNKKISDVVSVYASYSVGYKAPVSSYFFIPTTGQVNTGLKPEKGSQIELGTKGSLLDNKLFYTVAVFDAKFSDKMTTVAVQNPENTATLYSYIVNGGSLHNKGLEVLVKYNAITSGDHFLTQLSPFTNLTYSDFQYEDFKYERIGKDSEQKDVVIVNDFSGNRVAGVPPLVFNLGVDLDTRIGLHGNINFNYRDAMYFTSDEVNQTESYGVLNAKLGLRRTIGPISFDVFAAANNITGSQYYYMVFLNQLPDAYLPAPFETNFFGGVNLQYTF